MVYSTTVVEYKQTISTYHQRRATTPAPRYYTSAALLHQRRATTPAHQPKYKSTLAALGRPPDRVNGFGRYPTSQMVSPIPAPCGGAGIDKIRTKKIPRRFRRGILGSRV